jgi:hypothetical protein
MSEVEKLMADVPAQDPHFLLGVMARIEQRRFRRELLLTGLLAGLGALMLGLVMPALEQAWDKSFAIPAHALARFANDGVLASLLLILTFAGPMLLRAARGRG